MLSEYYALVLLLLCGTHIRSSLGSCSSQVYPNTRAVNVQRVIWQGGLDQYSCCSICESLPECDAFELTANTCTLLKLKYAGVPPIATGMEQQGTLLGLIHHTQSATAAQSSICYDVDGQRTALVTREYCLSRGGQWTLKGKLSEVRYGDCTVEGGPVLSEAEQAQVCDESVCAAPVRWKQVDSTEAPPTGWCVGTAELAEQDFASVKAAVKGTWTIACLLDGNIAGAGYRYELERGETQFDLCSHYMYTNCCLDQGMHLPRTPNASGEDAFRFDLAIPNFITYAIMGGFFLFWNSMLAFALIGRTVAACFYMEWGRQICIACICPHWVVGILIPYLVGGPALAVVVSIPYLIAIPRACLHLRRQGYPLCPTLRRAFARAVGRPIPPNVANPPVARRGGRNQRPDDNLTEYGSDVEINIPAGAEDLVRLHSGTECCICLDPYKDEVMASCGHSFCSACITAVLRSSSTRHSGLCPLCRKEIFLRELRVVTRNSLLTEEMDKQRGQSALDTGAPQTPKSGTALLQCFSGRHPMFVDVQTAALPPPPPRALVTDGGATSTEEVAGSSVTSRVLVTARGQITGGRWAAAFHVKLTAPLPCQSLLLDLSIALEPPIGASGSSTDSARPLRTVCRTADIAQVLVVDEWRHLVIGMVQVSPEGATFEASLQASCSQGEQLWYSSLLIDCLVLTPAEDPPIPV